MAYKVIILYRLYMPSYFLGTFTEYPYVKKYILLHKLRCIITSFLLHILHNLHFK